MLRISVIGTLIFGHIYCSIVVVVDVCFTNFIFGIFYLISYLLLSVCFEILFIACCSMKGFNISKYLFFTVIFYLGLLLFFLLIKVDLAVWNLHQHSLKFMCVFYFSSRCSKEEDFVDSEIT